MSKMINRLSDLEEGGGFEKSLMDNESNLDRTMKFYMMRLFEVFVV